MEELVLRRDSKEIHATLYGKSTRGILLCPPHPGYGGSRRDPRLVTIANELANSKIAALCLDYSAYTGGTEEIMDTLFALDYMSKNMTSLGLIGYSYGAVVASNVASRFQNLKGFVLISPPKKVNGLNIDLNSTCKKLIIYGLKDEFVIEDIDQIFNLARGEKEKLAIDTDHFYLGYEAELARSVLKFFQEIL